MDELDTYRKAKTEFDGIWAAMHVSEEALVMAYAEVIKAGKSLPCEHGRPGDPCSNDGDYFIHLKPCCRHHGDILNLPHGRPQENQSG